MGVRLLNPLVRGRVRCKGVDPAKRPVRDALIFADVATLIEGAKR